VSRGTAHPQPLPIVELRQYRLHLGKRDALIDLFEREFIESQEALGMAIVGTFRDLDDADRFVWMRGFTDMTSRELRSKLTREPEVHRLEPTPRSALRD